MIIRYGTRKYNYGIGISQKTKFNEQQSQLPPGDLHSVN